MNTGRLTRAERLRLGTTFVLFWLGAALSASLSGGLASVLVGNGWHPNTAYPTLTGFGQYLRAEPGARLVETHVADAPVPLMVGIGLVLFLLWLRYVVTPVKQAGGDPRHAGLGQWSEVRRFLSPAAARRAGRFTRPDLSWWQRRRAPLTEFGYHLGRMRGTRHQLWANPELRVRVIARTGWGKSARLLVKIAREVPGAALIGSTKPDLFEQTVRARQRGRQLPRGWRFWTSAFWRPGHGPGRRVLVVDFSERTSRYAAGFDRVRWNPLDGCEDWELAQRRARALVAGAEDGDRGDDKDGFFRDSAADVIAAWFHAAALAREPITTVVRWQQNIDLPEPKDVLRRHRAAEKAALLALDKHLDRRADRTTSSVERFVLLAMAPFATRDGQEFATGPSVNIGDLIREEASIYLLASPTTAAAVSPILTMFADEWFHAARQVARSLPGRRLPVPAVGVLDELRALVPIPSLPQVAYEMRADGIGLVYALQNGAQEVELYHEAAKSLAQNVQLTIVGGYDEHLVDELVAQAGHVAVASPSVSGSLLGTPEFSESTQWREAITPADLQQLKDGDSVCRLAGVTPFYAYSPSFRQSRRLRRAIAAEERSVRGDVAAARAADDAERDSFTAAAQAHYDSPRATA